MQVIIYGTREAIDTAVLIITVLQNMMAVGFPSVAALHHFVSLARPSKLKGRLLTSEMLYVSIKFGCHSYTEGGFNM
jgi:hypothetical protein